MVHSAWREAGLLLAGGLTAFGLMLGPLLWYERRGGVDIDQIWVPLLAVAALVGLALAWRHAAARTAFSGAALVLVFFALALQGWWLQAGLFLLLGAGIVVWRAPAPVRLLLGVPFVWGAAFAISLSASASDALAPLSGLLLAAIGLAYPVVWALREPVRWARHTAWASALVWCAVTAAYALLDLAAIGDGLAVVSSLLLVLAFVAVLVVWPLHTRGAVVAVRA